MPPYDDPGGVMRQMVLRIVLGSVFLVALHSALRVYLVQEIFSVLLAMGVAVVTLMLVPVAFVLLQCSTHRALPWLKKVQELF